MSLLTWHRPEYEGRESELINQNGIADLAGVTRSAVSNWTVRDALFPLVVAVQGIQATAPRLYVRTEVEVWLANRSVQSRRAPRTRTPARPRREILTERAERAGRQVDEEKGRMAALYEQLGRTAERLKKAQDALAAATVELDALG